MYCVLVCQHDGLSSNSAVLTAGRLPWLEDHTYNMSHAKGGGGQGGKGVGVEWSGGVGREESKRWWTATKC